MSRKQENVFIGWVHTHLPKHIYAEKTNNPYRRGTPDCYYEAPGSIMWVEYKWLHKLPELLFPPEIADFTKLQQRWLKRAHDNGTSVAVIIGSPEGIIVCSGLDWMRSFKPQPITKQEAIQWILARLK